MTENKKGIKKQNVNLEFTAHRLRNGSTAEIITRPEGNMRPATDWRWCAGKYENPHSFFFFVG